jgi:ATP-dependent helicase/nuclease subunit A
MTLDPVAQAREDQAKAATPSASAWVAANAGSGKTKVLIDRVARLLLLPGADPDQILCVTYTKAAATEMQDRLFQRLGDWCVMDRAALAAQLTELEGRQEFTDVEIDNARALFARALETPGGLRIETIHAFCGRVLRRFPLEAGVAPGFRELDEEASSDLWDEAFCALGGAVASGEEALVEAARIVAEEGGSDLSVLRRLDARRAQVEAFITRHGGVPKAAEALRRHIGAGKHSVDEILERAMGPDLPRADLARAAELFRSGAKSDQEKAACIDIALSDAPAEERFNALCSVPFTKAGEPRKAVFTKPLRASAPLLVDLFDNDSPQGRETLRLIAVSEAIAARRTWEKSAALLGLARTVFGEFKRLKDAQAGLDFDDLIQSVGRLLTRARAAEWVLWKLDGGINHLLLDEAQDTSPEQWRILRALTDDIFVGAGAARPSPRTLFVVGDQKQSIYSFQGADPEHFLREGRGVRERANVGDVRLNTPSLAMSFRSSPEVLAYVDEVFDPKHFDGGAPFSVQVPIELDQERHIAHRAEQPGLVELWPLEPPQDAAEPDPWFAPVDQESQESPRARLARRIAAFVKREIDTGARIWERGQPRPARPGDFLILVKRRTGGLFDAVLQSLKAAGLPVAGADRIQLLDSLAVQDMLNLARFALCPEDDLVLAEILKGPFCGLSEEALFDLAHGRELPIGKQPRETLWSRVQASASPARSFLDDLLKRRHEAPLEFLSHALERPAPGNARTGWELMLARLGDPAREPVTALLDRAAAYDASAPPSLQLFLDAIEHHGGEVKRELSGAGDAVRVMTVHGAKGLQAPVVILPDTTSAPKYDSSGLFVLEGEDERDPMRGAPIWVGSGAHDTPATAALRQAGKDRVLREHRRLLYVALTRAQDRILICGAWSGAAGGAGRDKDSWHALCEAGMQRLADAGHASVFTEPPSERPHHRLGALASATGHVAAVLGDAALPAWIGKPAPLESGVQRVRAPSSLGGAEPPPLSPFGPDRESRFRRGRLIHSLFEHLPDIAPRSRRKAGRDFLARQPDLSPDQREEMLEAALAVLDDGAFARVFARGGRAEAPVVGRLGSDLINGRVDRLVILPEEILIVDYKTDRPAPDDIEAVGHAYVTQLAAYREILGRTWPDRPIRCLLVWTDGPKLMEIPPRMLDAAIRALTP